MVVKSVGEEERIKTSKHSNAVLIEGLLSKVIDRSYEKTLYCTENIKGN